MIRYHSIQNALLTNLKDVKVGQPAKKRAGRVGVSDPPICCSSVRLARQLIFFMFKIKID